MTEHDPAQVGERLRDYRQERGLSLRALAELCELSPNTISLIERGMTSPSVSTLQKLAVALGVAINSFFVEPEDGRKVIVTRQGQRTRSGSASVILESLGYGLEGQTCDPFIVTLKSGANSGRQMMAHQGTELILCIEGELDLEIAGEHHLLRPGDTVLFRAEQPHSWRNPNSGPAIFLMMMQITEEREASVEQHLHP